MTPPELYRAWLLTVDQQTRFDDFVDHWTRNLHRLPVGPHLTEYGQSITEARTKVFFDLIPYQHWLTEKQEEFYHSDVAKNSWFRRSPAWHVTYLDTLYDCKPTELDFAIHLLRMHSNHLYSCLYLGSGRGVWKRELASFSPIVCADINPQLFDYVRAGYNPFFFEMDRMRFVTVKMKELQGMPDASVEFVFSWATFPMLPPDEISAMLKEINRVLKPGGRAMVNFADAFNSEDYAWIEQKHWAYMDRWKFIDLVRRENFVPLKITVDDAPRSTCMLFQKLGNDSIYGMVSENYEKLDTQTLDRLITISNIPKEESQS
jgi:SAM-dependent methyltransferase